LNRFVEQALAAGHDRADIRKALAEAGWSAAAIDKALGGFADVAFSPPVPRPQPQVTARDAFVYAILFTALLFTATNLINLVHALIDTWLPPPGSFPGGEIWLAGRIRWSIAALIVAAPLYLWLTIATGRRLARDPEARRSPVRRWITYLALFVAAVTLFGDAVYTIYRFLMGELTVPFVLKAATVAAVAGAVLAFHLRDVADRPDER
jgi:hypothetical protein